MTPKDLLTRYPYIQATEPMAAMALQQAHLLAANQQAAVAVLAAALLLTANFSQLLNSNQDVQK